MSTSKPAARRSLRVLMRGDRVVPLYHQVQQLLRGRIERGEYRPGARVASEHELCRELDVSRVTVREALRDLVRDGLLVKIQGKGTFVAEQVGRRKVRPKFTGFVDGTDGRTRRLEVTFAAVDRVPLGIEVGALLQLSDTDTEVVRIRRTRFVDGGPFSYTVNFLPVAIGSRIEPGVLYERPLIDILHEDLGVPVLRSREVVEAASADPEVAAQLELSVLSPVLRVRRTMFSGADRPVELVETFYRADKYQCSIDRVRVQRDGKWHWVQQAPPESYGPPSCDTVE